MELKMKDIAELLQVSEKTIYRWIMDNKIPAYRINHQYRFNRAEINEWILKNKISVSNKILDMNLTSRPVSIAELLRKGGVFHGIGGKDVREIIKNAVSKMTIPAETSRQAVIASLIEREEMMPTAIGKGIAIPHPRNPILADIGNESITIAFLDQPIDYKAIDSIPVKALFILLSANPRRHLEILSKISFLCQQEDFNQLIRIQANIDELLAYISSKEAEWNKR